MFVKEGRAGFYHDLISLPTPVRHLEGASKLRYEVAQISAGQEHMVLLSSAGHMYTCGGGSSGKLGQADGESLVQFDQVPLRAEWLLEEDALRTMHCVAAGKGHTLAATSLGELLVFGSNRFGELGLGQEVRNARAPMFHPGFRIYVEPSWKEGAEPEAPLPR
eukprot:TRINITY_DN13459_c0_g2_i3.p1 TRINITY_DN13459_c0_g2~~TRINITY_DN13459_c0_g2_i3.p1  ORF type:complete len:163 (+),score=28.42 TRINITY_DN13459_c0_g2_i3:116-604(+)